MKTRRQHFVADEISFKRKGNSQIELLITEYRGDFDTQITHEIYIDLAPCFIKGIANDLWRCIEGWQDELETMMTALREGQ